MPRTETPLQIELTSNGFDVLHFNEKVVIRSTDLTFKSSIDLFVN